MLVVEPAHRSFIVLDADRDAVILRSAFAVLGVRVAGTDT